MSTINKIILVAVSIMLLAASAVIGFTNLQTSKDNTAMPEKSNTTLHGGYDAYDDTYISGTQVETALTIYGSVDRGGHGKVSGDLADGEVYIPYTDSGYCYVQNGGSLARSEGKNADDWIKDPNYADHLVNYTGDGGITQDDFKDYHNQKKEASYLNPEGLFHATLVLGEDMADEDLRLNYPNKVMYIKFTQVKQHNNVPPPDPSAPTEEPVPVEPSGTPDELNFIICDKPVIWEGTYKTDLLKDIVKAQGIKVEFYETSGPEVSTTIIPDADWNFIDTSVTFRATDLSNKQKVKVSYKGLTGTMKFTVVQLLSINGMVTDSYKPNLYPGASHSVDVNHFRTSRAGSGIDKVKYNPGTPVKVGEITDGNGNPISDSVTYDKQIFKSTASGSSFSDHLEMTVGAPVDGYKATRKLDILLTWSNVRIGYFNHTAAYAYYVAKYGTDESNVDTYWNELKTYCSYLEDVEDTFREGEEHANKRAWILGVGDDSGWTKRSRGSAHYEIIGATDPKGPITSQIAEGDVVTFYSNVAGMTLASNGDTGLQTVTTFAEGGAQVPQSSVISSFLTYRAAEHKTAIIGFNFPDSGNKSVVNYFNDNGSVRGLSVKQALCPMVGKQTLRNSSYNFVTKTGISQEYNDSDDATTAWTTKNGKGDNRWCVDYVTNGRTPLTISNENSVAWEFPAAKEARTFSSEKGTKMTVTEDSKCIEMGSRTSDSDSLNVSLKAELEMKKDGNSFKGGDQGFRLLQASFKDFGGRYTGVYTIYNWYPSVVVKANCGVEKEGETGHVAQPGEPYIVNVSQADADVTVNCSDPLMQDVMWEDASNDAFSFGSWSTGSPITWAKNATVTTEMKTDEDGNRVTKYPNAANVSLAIKATRKRVSDVSAASVEFKERSTKLYTYKWYIGGNSHSEPLSSDNECDKGTKADTSTGECKDKNRIAVSDYIMNAQNIDDSSINEMTIKLYESGSNNTNAPAKEPTGKPLATLGNGATDNDYMKFNGKTLYLKREKLTERQVYTLVVQGKQGSDTVNGETYSWGPNPVYYYVYNLYNSKFNNEIASETDDCDVSESKGVYSVVLDKDSEIYVKSFYSAIYKTANFSPSSVFTFKKGTSGTNDYSRTIVNAKDNGTRNSNKKNADRDTKADYFHVYAKAAAATYNGEDAKIKVVHPEFANRTKATKMKLYKKFTKTVHVTELHSISIDENTEDDKGNKIDSLKGCTLRMKYIGSDRDAYNVESGTPERGTGYDEWVSLQTVEDDANKNKGKFNSNKYVHSAKIASGEITIVTKAYYEDDDGNNSPCLIDVVNSKGRLLGTITVYTEPFIAKHFTRLKDNIGYGDNTLGKNIYVETSKAYIGDKLYVLSNTGEDSVKTEVKLKNTENLSDINIGFTISEVNTKVKSNQVVKPNGKKAEVLKTGNTVFKAQQIELSATINNGDPFSYWAGVSALQNNELVFTTKDMGCDECYKGEEREYETTISLAIVPGGGIVNNMWYVDDNTTYPGACIRRPVDDVGGANFMDTQFLSAIDEKVHLFTKVSYPGTSLVGRFKNENVKKIGERLPALTSYNFLNVRNANGALSLVANKSGALGDNPATSDMLAMSPLINKEVTNDSYKKYTNLMWGNNWITNSLIGTGDANPIAGSGTNFDNKHYVGVLYSGEYNVGAGVTPVLHEQAIAQFKTSTDNSGDDYLYFNVNTHSVMVTYQINGGALKVIKKVKSKKFKDQSSYLYSRGSSSFKGFKYDDKGRIEGLYTGLSLDNIIFGEKVRTNFRENNVEVGTDWSGTRFDTGTVNVDSRNGAFSGEDATNSVLWISELSNLLGCSVANGNSGATNEPYSDTSVYLKLNATQLGWTGTDVEYVDVYITCFSYDATGCRQFTFPYRLLGKGSQVR